MGGSSMACTPKEKIQRAAIGESTAASGKAPAKRRTCRGWWLTHGKPMEDSEKVNNYVYIYNYIYIISYKTYIICIYI